VSCPPVGAGTLIGAIRGAGTGYEPQPLGARTDPSAVRGYFVDLTAKTSAATAELPEALPPAGLAQLALGWWERSLGGDPGAWARFERVCAMLADRGSSVPDGVRWPYALAVPKYGLRAPWFSAMAQGQAASVFVRAFLASGDERWRSLALDAVGPLVVGRESDLVAFLPEGPVLQEVPGEPRAHVLNGWIYALWGLWDVHVGLDETNAGTRFRESADALAAILNRYDVGWWTRYSLYPHALADLAKPFYHRLHVTQMEAMARLTGRTEFDGAARRWRGYDNRRHLGRALGQKLVFRAAGWSRGR
jgi:heparosan-N-sulfate-glucuronate 5-epimerase